VTPEEYQAAIKSLGLTPAKPSYQGATLHRDRDGMHHSIPDPLQLSTEERADFINLVQTRMGLTHH